MHTRGNNFDLLVGSAGRVLLIFHTKLDRGNGSYITSYITSVHTEGTEQAPVVKRHI